MMENRSFDHLMSLDLSMAAQDGCSIGQPSARAVVDTDVKKGDGPAAKFPRKWALRVARSCTAKQATAVREKFKHHP
jgi:hypothetical protein